MKEIQVTSNIDRVLGLCSENRDAANFFARDLGFAEFNPAKPTSIVEARKLLADLRTLRWELATRVAERNERARDFADAVEADRIEAISVANDLMVEIRSPHLPAERIYQIISSELAKRGDRVGQNAA